jgi:hypothetical protein
MSACIPFPLSLVGAVYWSELGSYVRGQNQYFEGKKRKKLQRSTGRQQAFFSLTSFYFILCWPCTPMITTQVDAVLNARNYLGNGPADMQMSVGF